MIGRVLVIAGSDSGGGAGIQADIKSISALGAYAACAITALTAQNTLGVHGVMKVSPEFIDKQIIAVLDDIGADCIKTGMLHDSMVIETVLRTLEHKASDVPVVVDPVMIAKGGAPLLKAEAIVTLREELVPRATLLTPNIPEAEAILNRKLKGRDDMQAMGEELFDLGSKAVLLKGGHMEGPIVWDFLISNDGSRFYQNERIATSHTHGTGCTLASSIAAGIANGLTIERAVTQAETFLNKAIQTAPGIGKGHGPINHLHTVQSS
tara:strand:+ start:107 stop:904 length:798 start_codon:yes stop_codon:yes gene_type:complete